MSTEFLIAIIAPTSTAIGFLIRHLIEKYKKKKLACQIDTWLMRNSLINIYKRCYDKQKRTDLDTKIFYEGFEIYTKKMGQNSYICQDVEPSFNKIKLQ